MPKPLITKELECCWQRFTDYRFLPLILMLSLALNLWGNRWGAPNFWHPDEVTSWTISMVENRTLNPHYFTYGGLHYYIVAVGAFVPAKVYERIFDPKPDNLETAAGTQWYERHTARIIQTARTISALMSMLVVSFTFIIGTILFDKRVGYLAAVLLTVSMSFVGIAHFATVDSPANFWYWLSCLFALLIWKRGDQRWYVLAGVTAGFAIGTKIDRAMILLPLLLSHCLRRERLQSAELLLLAVVIPASYLLVNPPIFFYFFEFLDGFTRELFINALRGEYSNTPSYLRMMGDTKDGLGIPLFVGAVAGSAYGLCKLGQRKDLRTITWLLSTFLLYYVFFSLRVGLPWYVPLVFPPLMICASYGCVEALSALPGRYVGVLKAVVAMIIAYSCLNTVALVLQFSYDARYQAGEWIEEYVAPNATIEMMWWAPVISKDRYRIIEASAVGEGWSDSWTARQVYKLDHNETYQKIRRSILSLEQWAGRTLGVSVRKGPYMGWYDQERAMYEKSLKQVGGIFRVQTEEPEYVVLMGEILAKKLSTLKSQESGYRLVAEFQFSNPLGFQASFAFVNPRVYIFQREASSS